MEAPLRIEYYRWTGSRGLGAECHQRIEPVGAAQQLIRRHLSVGSSKNHTGIGNTAPGVEDPQLASWVELNGPRKIKRPTVYVRPGRSLCSPVHCQRM